ncbi:YlxR family protein [Parafrigoribacterium mesophilum]|uniref:YlxR family protein n=1 Tax=Parafrigoribacterium mesophilum TaxID=433646 RepID=UPI0031FDA3FD
MEHVRTCLGCRARADRSSLTRVVARNGEVVVDRSATLPGRGAWVHPTLGCVEKALTRKAFGRALRTDGAVVVSAATAQQLKQAVHPTEVPPPVGTRPSENKSPERSMKNRLNGTVNL